MGKRKRGESGKFLLNFSSIFYFLNNLRTDVCCTVTYIYEIGLFVGPLVNRKEQCNTSWRVFTVRLRTCKPVSGITEKLFFTRKVKKEILVSDLHAVMQSWCLFSA